MRVAAGVAVLVAAAGLGCDGAAPPPGAVRTDSAGVAIVTSHSPQWAPGEGWTVDPEPMVEIGVLRGDPDYEFADLVAAVRLDRGDIVVADHGARELRGFDSAGRFMWRSGRSGEGPGEFESLDYLGVAPGDTLVTYDNALARVQLFGPDGDLARVLRVALADDAGGGTSVPDKVVGMVDDRLAIRFIEYGDDVPEGIVRWPLERLATVNLTSGEVRSLAVVPGHETSASRRGDGGYSLGNVHFSRGPEYGAAAGRLAVIDTEAWSARLLDADGALRSIVRRPVEPRAPTDAVFDRELTGLQGLATGAEPDQIAQLTRMWRGWPRAALLPVLRSVHLDAGGNLWLHPFHLTGAEVPAYEVHARDGTWLGPVALPPGLALGYVAYQAPYLEIGDDYVLGIWLDDLEVQYVRMHRLSK